MISKLCKYGFVGLRHLNKLTNKPMLQNIHNSHLLSISVRFISTETEYNTSLDNFFEIPNMPEPVSDIILNSIGEPTFASIGLNNYTPSGFVQFILENIHNHLGLPWWACIIITSVCVKTILIPVLLSQRRAMVKYQSDLQYSTRVISDAIDARKRGDSLRMYEIIKDFNEFQSELMLTFFNLFKPIAIQGPAFLSVFFALKGMAKVPVASLATGGLWWFTDLTVCDPYYILPCITAGTIFLMIELGVEFPQGHARSQKMLLRCIAPTLLLYWSCSNIFGLLFSQLTKSQKFRQAMNIKEFNRLPPVHNPNNYGMRETMEVINSLTEVLMREKEASERWHKDSQHQILNEGLVAAEVRKKMKESMAKHDKSPVHVVGEVIEDENKKNKI